MAAQDSELTDCRCLHRRRMCPPCRAAARAYKVQQQREADARKTTFADRCKSRQLRLQRLAASNPAPCAAVSAARWSLAFAAGGGR